MWPWISCHVTLGGHDHTPEWLIINIVFWKYKSQRLQDYRYVVKDLSLIEIVIYINTASTTTTTTTTTTASTTTTTNTTTITTITQWVIDKCRYVIKEWFNINKMK